MDDLDFCYSIFFLEEFCIKNNKSIDYVVNTYMLVARDTYERIFKANLKISLVNYIKRRKLSIPYDRNTNYKFNQPINNIKDYGKKVKNREPDYFIDAISSFDFIKSRYPLDWYDPIIDLCCFKVNTYSDINLFSFRYNDIIFSFEIYKTVESIKDHHFKMPDSYLGEGQFLINHDFYDLYIPSRILVPPKILVSDIAYCLRNNLDLFENNIIFSFSAKDQNNIWSCKSSSGHDNNFILLKNNSPCIDLEGLSAFLHQKMKEIQQNIVNDSDII